jgi:hypothetical protein
MICPAGTEFMDLMKLKLNSFIENYLPAGMQGPTFLIYRIAGTRGRRK